MIRDLDHCEAVNGLYQCETDQCVQAIEALAAGWNDCESLLGLSQDILSDFQLVCGTCSPFPIFDICGFGAYSGSKADNVYARCAVGCQCAIRVHSYLLGSSHCQLD